MNPTDVKKTPTDDSPCGTYVYIWKTTAKKVGHVAINVVDCTGSKPQQKYSSLHPSLIPAIGPTIVLPLPAKLSTSLQQDMEIEASYAKPTVPPQDEPSLPYRINSSTQQLPPDHTFHIPRLDTRAMLSFMDKEQSKVESGETSYQLFPKVNAIGFFKDITKYLSYNPVDIGDISRDRTSTKPPRAYNCATYVNRILNEGGLPVRESKTPWGQSPNDLAEQLFKCL